MATIIERVAELQKELEVFHENNQYDNPQSVTNVFFLMKLAELEEKVNSILNRPETLI